MKKNYNNPKMNISLFEKEDIVTGSDVTAEKTGYELAEQRLTEKNVTNIIKMTF